MRTRSLHRLTAIAALALTPMAAAAACGSAPVPSLAGQTPSSATPSTTVPSSPPSATTQATTNSPACLGAVTHVIDAAKSGPPWPRLCIAVGGVLQVDNVLGPEGLSGNPADRFSCYYEAGTHVCRLVRTGTVLFTITSSSGSGPLTVLVAEASSPPGPSTACDGAVTYTIDASDGEEPPPAAMCLKVGAVLRLENVEPDRFSVEPSDMASCKPEGGVRECRFVKPGTVTLKIPPARPLTVVVIK